MRGGRAGHETEKFPEVVLLLPLLLLLLLLSTAYSTVR